MTGQPAPIGELLRLALTAITVVAADVDGTVTTAGRIEPATVEAFEALQGAGCRVVLVTGRSAGWGAALARYTPGLAGVVAENGAVLLRISDGEEPPRLLDLRLAGDQGPSLEAAEECLLAVLERYPEARPGVDNFCRLTDRTVEVSPEIDPAVVATIASRFGLVHTYSSVHHHFSRSLLTKRSGLLAALALIAPEVRPTTDVVTIGDSGNDAALFDPTSFAATVGVAGVRNHFDALAGSLPSFVTKADGGAGFTELAALILRAR